MVQNSLQIAYGSELLHLMMLCKYIETLYLNKYHFINTIDIQ